MGGWAAGRLEESALSLTQPRLAGTGAELGNIEYLSQVKLKLIEAEKVWVIKDTNHSFLCK